jgi:cytochrome c peroxidase
MRTPFLSCLAIAAGTSVLVLGPRDHRNDFDREIQRNAERLLEEGKETFRHDTFGSEEFFGDVLRLHEMIKGTRFGGVGPGLSPRAALMAGLKVDVDALPSSLRNAIRRGNVDLDDPATTLALLKLGAVVGMTGFFDHNGLRSVGIQCAFCHSTVDDDLAPGIGNRLDGWPNRDLNVGGILAVAPNVFAIADILQVDVDTVRKVLLGWGPGKFDAQLLLDGKGFRPDGKSAATLLPPAFGLSGVNQHTWTGAWGSVTYWNAFVANIEMQGKGTFFDPRLDDPVKYPVAARMRLGHVRSQEDRITKKLAALHYYQLSIPAPKPPNGSYDRHAAERGKSVFEGRGQCATCHVPPLFTEPGWNLHTPEEIGIDDFQAKRSPDGRYRTAPLRGLWVHHKGGFYHDGRFATLRDVVDHYDHVKALGLGEGEKNDLVEYLKSL